MIYHVNLQLFAQGAGAEDKTEKATPKKRRDARKKGQVFQSREITSSLVLMAIFIMLKLLGSTIYSRISGFTVSILDGFSDVSDLYMPDVLIRVFIDGAIVFLVTAGPLLLIAVFTGLLVSYAQVGALFTTETLKLQFNRINPLSGFKRLFSSRGLVELLKALLKIVVVGYVSYGYLNSKATVIMSLMDMELISIASFIGISCMDLAIRICMVLLILGVFDFAYQWWEYEKNLKMSKQELKEEYKQTEGNPEIKSRIKQMQRQMSMRRMMQEIPKADVVITNPTHYACALRYEARESEAPTLVAKGQDYLAIRIKETAMKHKVEIVENKPLAKTIYDTVDIGEAIPPELYQAVAEVLAFVYGLKGKEVI